eukprot:5314966-Amphidinium_carterae.1
MASNEVVRRLTRSMSRNKICKSSEQQGLQAQQHGFVCKYKQRACVCVCVCFEERVCAICVFDVSTDSSMFRWMVACAGDMQPRETSHCSRKVRGIGGGSCCPGQGTGNKSKHCMTRTVLRKNRVCLRWSAAPQECLIQRSTVSQEPDQPDSSTI